MSQDSTQQTRWYYFGLIIRILHLDKTFKAKQYNNTLKNYLHKKIKTIFNLKQVYEKINTENKQARKKVSTSIVKAVLIKKSGIVLRFLSQKKILSSFHLFNYRSLLSAPMRFSLSRKIQLADGRLNIYSISPGYTRTSVYPCLTVRRTCSLVRSEQDFTFCIFHEGRWNQWECKFNQSSKDNLKRFHHHVITTSSPS